MGQEKYYRVDSLQLGCPIQVIGYYIFDEEFDEENLDRHALIISRNISNQNITAFKGIIIAYDSFLNLLGEIDFQYIEMEEFGCGQETGFDNYIKILNGSSTLEIVIEEVVYNYKSKQLIENKSGNNIRNFYNSNSEFLNLYLTPFLNNEKYLTDPVNFHDQYLCVCGSMNYQNDKCWNCDLQKSIIDTAAMIQNPNLKSLILHYQKKLDKKFKDFNFIKNKIETSKNHIDLNRIKLPPEKDFNRFQKLYIELQDGDKELFQKLYPSFQMELLENLKSLIKLKENRFKALFDFYEKEQERKKENKKNQKAIDKKNNEEKRLEFRKNIYKSLQISILILIFQIILLIINVMDNGNFDRINPFYLFWNWSNLDYLGFMFNIVVYGTFWNIMIINIYKFYQNLKLLNQKISIKTLQNHPKNNREPVIKNLVLILIWLIISGGALGFLLFSLISLISFFDLINIGFVIFFSAIYIGSTFAAVMYTEDLF